MLQKCTDGPIRAWSALSIAIRCGQGLGMHLKNVTPSMGEVETLHGIYVWSALVSAERTLSIIVGRPCGSLLPISKYHALQINS